MDQFGYAKLKIKRANKHIDDFKSVADGVEKAKRSCTDESIEHGAVRITHEIVDAEGMLFEMALIMGDALHNLKSALDYAWTGAMSRVPGVATNHSKFPVSDTREGLAAMVNSTQIESLSPSLYSLIMDHLQPYQSSDTFIWEIHRLNIIDKHKLLVPTYMRVGVSDMKLRNKITGREVCGDSWQTRYDAPLHFDFFIEEEIKNKGHLSASILFDEGVPIENREIRGTLDDFLAVVCNTVELLESVPTP